MFRALANQHRRAILDTLRDQPLTTGALCDLFADLDRCTVMQHLKVLEAGKTVTWDFHDFPGAFPVHVKEVVPDEKIVFEWQAGEPGAEQAITVTMTFTAVEDGRTKVEVAESGWSDSDAGLKASYGNCMGWSQMLAAMKAWKEYGINLREGAYK